MPAKKKQEPLTYQQFRLNLADGKLPGQALFFYGAEPYLIDQALQAFANAHLDQESKQYGTVKLDGETTTWTDLENALMSVQMFAPTKVVILTHPARLPTKSQTALTNYLSNPADNTWLALIDPEADWRKKPYSTWANLVTQVLCDPLTGNELAEWITETVQQNNLQIGPDQIRFLETISNGDMQIIFGILDKVFLLTEPGDHITDLILETATGSSCRYSWDSLLTAIADRDPQMLWQVIDYLHKQSPTATYFTQILSRTFLGALIAQQSQANIPFDIAIYKSVGYFGKARTLINNIARNYTREEIESALHEIRATDRQLKSTPKSTLPQIYQLLGKIILSEKIRNFEEIREY
jgi:DNA polymerase III delta subunit